MSEANIKTSPVDRPVVIISTFLLGAIAVTVFFTLPILLGLMADKYGFAEAELGRISATYFGVYAFSAATSVYWARRYSWRTIGLLATVLAAVGILLAGLVDSVTLLYISVAVAGLGAGALLALSYTITSDMSEVDRKFGLKLMVEQAYPAGLLFLYSATVAGTWAMRDTFTALALVMGVTGLVSLLLPSDNPQRTEMAKRAQSTNVFPVFAGLFALLLFFAGFTGVWVFIERLGQENEINIQTIGTLVSLGVLTTAIGGLLAAVLGDRWGRLRPQLIASLAMFACLALLVGTVPLWQYAFALLVFPAAANFCIVYQSSLIASADIAGRYASLLAAAVSIGAMLGAAIAGELIERSGYSAVYVSDALLTVIALGIFGWLAWFTVKAPSVTPAASESQ